jgi:hypothetical protein
MTAPSIAILEHLTTQGLVDGEWVGFAGYFPPAPDRCISITDTAGDPPQASFAYEEPGVQLRVRGLRQDYVLTNTKVTNLFDALHAQPLGAHAQEYPDCLAVSGPMFHGFDAVDRPVWVVNFRLMRTR